MYVCAWLNALVYRARVTVRVPVCVHIGVVLSVGDLFGINLDLVGTRLSSGYDKV